MGQIVRNTHDTHNTVISIPPVLTNDHRAWLSRPGSRICSFCCLCKVVRCGVSCAWDSSGHKIRHERPHVSPVCGHRSVSCRTCTRAHAASDAHTGVFVEVKTWKWKQVWTDTLHFGKNHCGSSSVLQNHKWTVNTPGHKQNVSRDTLFHDTNCLVCG